MLLAVLNNVGIDTQMTKKNLRFRETVAIKACRLPLPSLLNCSNSTVVGMNGQPQAFFMVVIVS